MGAGGLDGSSQVEFGVLRLLLATERKKDVGSAKQLELEADVGSIFPEGIPVPPGPSLAPASDEQPSLSSAPSPYAPCSRGRPAVVIG